MKIGIDIGGSHIGIGVINNNGFVIERIEKRLLQNDKKDIKNSIENYIIKNVNDLSQKYKITQVGISIPGTVNDKKIIKSVNLGLENYNIVERLSKHINLPIKIRNDAKCAAIAENKYGALKNYNRTIFLTLGTGIGGAVILNGKLLDTGELPGVEFGHMIIQKDGIQCNCGKKGCFEKYASMKSLKDNLRKELKLDENITGEQLFNIVRKNEKNENIQSIINEFIEYLSIGISNIINIFEPEAIIIGGSFVFATDILLDKLKKNINEKNYLYNKREELIIIPAILKNDAGMIGSCE